MRKLSKIKNKFKRVGNARAQPTLEKTSFLLFFSSLDDDELLVEDPEIPVGTDRHRDVAGALAARVPGARHDRLAVWQEERLPRLHVDRDDPVLRRLPVLVERVVIGAHAPSGRAGELLQPDHDHLASGLELLGRAVELGLHEEVPQRAGRILPEGLSDVPPPLEGELDQDVTGRLDLLDELHERDARRRLDDLHPTDGDTDAAHTLSPHLRVRTLHDTRNRGEALHLERERETTDRVVDVSHRNSMSELTLFHAILHE